MNIREDLNICSFIVGDDNTVSICKINDNAILRV